MPLSPSVAATAISTGYQSFASVGPDGLPTGSPGAGDFPAVFASGYDTYAAAGVVLGAVNSGGDASILEDFMRGVSSASVTVTDFALALASYWATVAVTPGTPAHGGTSVVSVVNDAAAHVADFQAAIVASITSSESAPWFETLVTNIQTMAVSLIIWTVTETIPPTMTPTPFPEPIA